MRGSRNFRQGGGVQVNLTKKALTSFFFSPQLILQKSMVNFKEYHLFFKVPGGSNNNQGEGYQLFPGGGPIAYFPIETHITCDFPGGGGPDPLSPPLWIRT